MDSAAILELRAGFRADRDDPVARALVDRARADAALDEEGPLRTLSGDAEALRRTAALVVFALGAEPRPKPDALAAVFRCLLLVDAIEHRLDVLVDPDASPDGAAARDLEVLPAAATGALQAPAGPLSAWVASIRTGFVALPGWPATGDLFSSALANCVDGLLAEHRLRSLGSPSALATSSRTAIAIASTVRACSLALADDTELRQPSETEAALRFAADVLGTAHDLGCDDQSVGERVAARLGLPASVIRMSTEELRRILRATFELQLHDLAETLARIDADRPWRGLVARVTAARLALDCAATTRAEAANPLPSRAEVMNILRGVARGEGPITSDARALLRRMDTHLHDLEGLIERIEEDSVVDFEELGQLRTTRQAILEDLLRVALADDEITEDERRVLVRAIELLPALR